MVPYCRKYTKLTRMRLMDVKPSAKYVFEWSQNVCRARVSNNVPLRNKGQLLGATIKCTLFGRRSLPNTFAPYSGS